MLTEEERDWKNNKDLTELQKEFLFGMDWVRKEVIEGALMLWSDNNRTGYETIDKIMDEVLSDLTEHLKEYIENDMEEVIISMLDENVG